MLETNIIYFFVGSDYTAQDRVVGTLQTSRFWKFKVVFRGQE